MNDTQRIKLVRVLHKVNDRIIRVLDKFYPDKNKSRPLCYEFKFLAGNNSDDPVITAYIGVVFGEILRFEFDDELWDSAMHKGEACSEKIRDIIDIALIKRAEFLLSMETTSENPPQTGILKPLPMTRETKKKIRECLKEIEND